MNEGSTQPRTIAGRLRMFLFARSRSLKLRRLIERAYPVIMGLLSGVACANADISVPTADALLDKVLPTAVTIATVLAGFQGAALSVLIAVLDRPIWRILRRTGHDIRLINFHWETILSLFTFIFLSLFAMVLTTLRLQETGWKVWFCCFVTGNLIHAGACCFRVIALMCDILKDSDGSS